MYKNQSINLLSTPLGPIKKPTNNRIEQIRLVKPEDKLLLKVFKTMYNQLEKRS